MPRKRPKKVVVEDTGIYRRVRYESDGTLEGEKALFEEVCCVPTAQAIHKTLAKIEKRVWKQWLGRFDPQEGPWPPNMPDDATAGELRAKELLFWIHVLRNAMKNGDPKHIAYSGMWAGKYLERLDITPIEPKVKGKKTSEENLEPGGKKQHDAKAFCQDVVEVMKLENKGLEKAREKVRKRPEWDFSRRTATRYWKEFGDSCVSTDRS